MKTRTRIVILTAISALQISCGSVGPVVTMTGETATVRLHDGTSQSVEILAVEDSSILCLPAPGDKSRATSGVTEIPAGSISQIEVSGFRNNNWWVGVLVFEVLPAAGFAVAAGSANVEDPGAVFLAALMPAALTTFLYAVTGVPTPTFEDPVTSEKLLELRKYARYGGKLTSSQKEQLLGMKAQAKPR
jgi:hypothetical protein